MRDAVNQGRYISATETQGSLGAGDPAAHRGADGDLVGQPLALVGAGSAHADFSIAPKEPPAWR